MLISLTGIPGTGKTSVAKLLKNFDIIELNQLAKEKNFIIGKDKKRKCQIIDLRKLNNYIKKNYKNERPSDKSDSRNALFKRIHPSTKVDEKCFEKSIEPMRQPSKDGLSPSDKNAILVGHYSHLLFSNLVIVLRCHPKILEKRLKKKKYGKEKIMENLIAEILDTITIEALQKNKNVYEIDTTKKSSNQVKKDIINIVEGNTEFKIGRNFKMQKFCHLTNKETLVEYYGFR